MRLMFFLVLVFITQKMWIAIGNKNFDPVNLVWYLMINETLMFGYGDKLQKDIFYNIRSGNIGYSLIRPFSYFGQLISEAMGIFAVRFLVMLLGGSIFTYVLAGGFPTTFYGIGVIFVLMLISGVFINLCLIGLGLTALYMQSSRSTYMIWQKMLWIFGGLMFPLTIYPKWMQNVAAKTPFSYSMYEISRLIYGFDWKIVWNTTIHLILWTLATFLFVLWFMLKKVSVNGG